MSEHQKSLVAEPVLMPRQPIQLVASGTILAVGVFAWATIFGNPFQTAHTASAPKSVADLGEHFIKIIDYRDHAAVTTAANALNLPPVQRREIERSVLAGDRRLGWIVFVDSMDPDGDAVAVEAGGFVQHVTLSKHWTPVAVPLDTIGRIAVTAVRDGGGGGVTVAFATKSGPVAIRIMLPGERIEVVAP